MKDKMDKLFAGDKLIGYLRPVDFDHLKVFCNFEATSEFSHLKEVFEERERIANEIMSGRWPDRSRRRANSQQLDEPRLRLVGPDGDEIELFDIAIHGDEAMWRLGMSRESQHNELKGFWDSLGPEIGPEECEEPGCHALRIGRAGYCKHHYFIRETGKDYESISDT